MEYALFFLLEVSMKEILNFINNNAVIASLITLFLSTIIQIIFRRNDRRYKEKQESKNERKKQFENKAEFMIDNYMEDDGTIPHLHLFMTDFNVEVVNDKANVEFCYSYDVLNKEKYNHLIFYLKNIGNADVRHLDVCVNSQKILCCVKLMR